MKKRIGVIIYQTSSSKGQELVAENMVRYFRRLGHEAFLITSVYHDGEQVISENSLGDDGYVLIDENELGIPIIRVAGFSSKWPPRRVLFKDSIYTLEKIVNEFKLNVLITHSTLWNGPEDVAKFVDWRRNVRESGGYQDPLVFCHMSHFQEPSPGRYSLVERSFRLAWNQLSLRAILRVANLILVVSPSEKESKTKMGARPEKLMLFPGGIDDNSSISYKTTISSEIFNNLKLPQDSKIIAYLGTLEERKNPKAVLEVAERLQNRRDIHFVIAGRGDSTYASDVRKWAATLPNVTCLGEISEREKIQLMQVSYANILLSRMEALGLTQLEFMFEGVPVITSGVGGQAWIIRDGVEGIHVQGSHDIEGAQKAVLQLADDHSVWQKLSAGARARANNFTLTKLIRDLDAALTTELEKETGLSVLPQEARSTLVEPELVVRTWSHGDRKIIATNQRIFVQEGRLSRRTTEMRYSDINSIEHISRYSWGVLLVGAVLSFLILFGRYLFPFLLNELTPIWPTLMQPSILMPIAAIPVAVALVIFLRSTRAGYVLQRISLRPIFLPRPFGETIKFIHEMHETPSLQRLKVELKKAKDKMEIGAYDDDF